jgi:hypothetical protein
MAAGIAILLAINLYTALSIKKAEPNMDTVANTEGVYESSVDNDTYDNYSLLVLDTNN